MKKLLEKEKKIVTVSEWKSAPVISPFMHSNESLTKIPDRILPETSVFMQSADLLYRLEREVIPALKQGHIVLLDRGYHTLLVRGLMIGMSDTQLRTGLLWWRNTIYKELFDSAKTVYFSIDTPLSLERLQSRTIAEERARLGKKYNKHKIDGTLLTLHHINTLIYAPDGSKMTRNDKKQFIFNTQHQIIETYKRVFQDEDSRYIELDGNQDLHTLATVLKKRIVDMLF